MRRNVYFQDLDIRKTMMLKPSSLPRSLLAVSAHLPTAGIVLNFPIDPTAPGPGPTFPMVVTDPEKAVSASTPRKPKVLHVTRRFMIVTKAIRPMPTKSE